MVKSLFTTDFKRMAMAKISSKGIKFAHANKTLEETEFQQAFIVNADSINFKFYPDDDRPERMVKSFFAATAQYLKLNKVEDPNVVVALILNDLVGTFKFAAIVQYHDNENKDEPGNYSITMTFYKEDIDNLEKKKNVKKILYEDKSFEMLFPKVAYDIGGLEYTHHNYLLDSYLIIIDTLTQVLDREADPNEVVDVEFPGYFTASVAVEDDEKVFSITPEGFLKTIIKDDTALDKK